MKQELHIIKVGGKLLEDENSKRAFLDQFSNISGLKILVHGGGSFATELSKKLGIPVKVKDGRRITDIATLNVAIMVYAGLVNKTLVAELQGNGCNSIGLTGADLDLIRAIKRPKAETDFGFVGDIVRINVEAFEKLFQNGFVPVICAISHDGEGQLLNTNADTIASKIASALSPHYKICLKFCLDKEGVQNTSEAENEVISSLCQKEFKSMQLSGAVHSGMIPKLQNGFEALENHVDEVIICGIQGLSRENHQNVTVLCK